MILVDMNRAPFRWLAPLQHAVSTFLRQRRTLPARASLDDRLRVDAGLPARGERPPLPHEAASRAAMLAWR